MYIPVAFAETDLAKLHRFIEQHSFGLLVSVSSGLPFASHLPFLFDCSAGANGTLIGHMARANPQWHEIGGSPSLAIFSGPHAYISPTWYEAEGVVPTWNYVAVHVYGQAEIIDDRPSVLDIVRNTVAKYEQAMPKSWSFDDSANTTERLLDQIVGFRIEIERIEGKWKLNQNHSTERREKVIRALEHRDQHGGRAIADLMKQSLALVEEK